MPWLDIVKYDATYAAKEITEWVVIGIDCYIPHRKFQLKPHSSPWFTHSCAAAIAIRSHYFHQYHPNANPNATPENKKLFCDSRNRCKRDLKEARSNYVETTRRSIASQLIGIRDFWKLCNSVLNREESTIPPLFNGPEVLATSTDKVNLFARNFSSIPPLMMALDLINNSLTKHLDITDLFSDLRYGFRAFRSTADILTVLGERIYNSLDAGGETRAIALDISKAPQAKSSFVESCS